jgi:hypothetical protein
VSGAAPDAPEEAMSTPAPSASLKISDWRVRLGVGATAIWLGLGMLYISNVVGWGDFVRHRAPELGEFLDGAFAPLAFLWFVVGFFLQQRQLEDNTAMLSQQLEVMRQSARQAEIQSRAIAADELHSRQDTFLRIAEMVSQQLGVTAGWLYTSWAAGEGEEAMSRALEIWGSQGAGDHGAFDRACVSLVYGSRIGAAELFWGTPIRGGHSESFLRAFERLLRLAERCDPDGVIADAIRGGTHGRVARFMLESRPRAGEVR